MREPLRVGAIIGTSVRMTGSFLLPLAGIALLTQAPRIVSALTGDMSAPPTEPGAALRILELTLAQLLSAAVAYMVVLKFRGHRPSVSQILRVLGMQMAPVVAVGLISDMSALLTNVQPLFSLVGIVVTVVLFVSVPIAIIEQPGIAQSLRRSAALTSGRRWNILGLVAVLVAMYLPVLLLLGVLFGEQGSIIDPGYQIVLSAFHAGLTVFGSVVASVAYLELRRLHINSYGAAYLGEL